MPESEWRPLDSPEPRWPWFFGGALLATLAVASYAEICQGQVSDWTRDHPIAVGVLMGVAFAALTALVLERLLTGLESRRWRTASMVAIDAYVFSADRAIGAIDTEIKRLVASLPSPPVGSWTFRLSEALQLLVDQRRSDCRDLSSFIRRETDELSLVALDAGATITRHRPHAATGEEIFVQLRSLGRVAEEVDGLSFKASGLGGDKDEQLQSLISKSISEVDERLQAFLHGLERMRLQVGEAPEDPSHPRQTWLPLR